MLIGNKLSKIPQAEVFQPVTILPDWMGEKQILYGEREVICLVRLNAVAGGRGG